MQGFGGLFAAKQAAQNCASFGVCRADRVTCAGICGCFKHLIVPLGWFRFLYPTWAIRLVRTNETFQRFS